MAVVGDQLLQPENGWRRYDQKLLTLDGNWQSENNAQFYNGSESFTGVNGNSVKFTAKTDKLRIIGTRYPNRSENIALNVNGELFSTFTQKGQLLYQSLTYEATFEDDALKEIEIINGDNGYFAIDAIDVSNEGYILVDRKIGDELLTPDGTWKRISNTNSLIRYNGYWEEEIDSTLSSRRLRKTKDIYSNISFCFTGTKLRIISKTDSTNRSNEIGISIDGKEYTYTEKLINGSNILTFQVLDLEDKNHKVIIYNKSRDSYLTFNAIDIDENGDLIADLNADYDFPIKIGSESNVERYSSNLINGEEQLLVTREGSLYLTDGLGSYKQINSNVSFNGENHTHNNKEEVLDKLKSIDNELYFNDDKIIGENLFYDNLLKLGLIPLENVALNQTYFAGSIHSDTYLPKYAFDNNYSTAWASKDPAGSDNCYVGVELSTPRRIEKLVLTQSSHATGLGCKDFELKASNDGIHYDSIISSTLNSGTGVSQEYATSCKKSYSFWTLYIKSVHSSVAAIIGDIKLMGAKFVSSAEENLDVMLMKEIDEYSTINDNNKLLINTDEGGLYLTCKDGTLKQIGVSLDKFNELEKRVLALEEKNA